MKYTADESYIKESPFDVSIYKWMVYNGVGPPVMDRLRAVSHIHASTVNPNYTYMGGSWNGRSSHHEVEYIWILGCSNFG